MKIYGIAGLGADERVFQYLKLDYAFVSLDWIEPLPDESIESYAGRLALSIAKKNLFFWE